MKCTKNQYDTSKHANRRVGNCHLILSFLLILEYLKHCTRSHYYLSLTMVILSVPSTHEPVSELEVRLVGGRGDRQGRVEVFYNDAWGTVCDDSWDIKDADVICRMLGFPGAESALLSAFFGEGPGSTVLDNVGCTGEEENIAQCIHNGMMVENCGHHEDAGVVCSPWGKQQFDKKYTGVF